MRCKDPAVNGSGATITESHGLVDLPLFYAILYLLWMSNSKVRKLVCEREQHILPSHKRFPAEFSGVAGLESACF